MFACLFLAGEDGAGWASPEKASTAVFISRLEERGNQYHLKKYLELSGHHRLEHLSPQIGKT